MTISTHNPIGWLFAGVVTLTLFVGLGACNGCDDRTAPPTALIPDDAAQRYADQLCEADAACGCGRYASQAECRADVVAAFELATTEISAFDDECFEQLLDDMQIRPCPSKQLEEDVFACVAIVGAAPEGAACERDPRMQALMGIGGTCTAELRCDLAVGLCVDGPTQTPTKQAGDPCTTHHPPSCGSADLYCSQASVCQARTLDGEPCTEARECALSSFCAAQSGSCTPQLELGEACNPIDREPCALVWNADMTSLQSSWCNPQTLQCELGTPYLCGVLDGPFVPFAP